MQEYPQITFSSTGVRPVDDTTFDVTGDLTIQGVTSPITIPFTFEGAAKDPFGNAGVAERQHAAGAAAHPGHPHCHRP